MESISAYIPAISINPASLQEMINHEQLSEEQKIAEASRQFEGILLRQFLKDALNPVVKGFLNEKGSSNDIYRYFLSDVLADSMSQDSVFGISSLLQMQLQNSQPKSEEK